MTDEPSQLSDEEQERRRAWFRRHWTEGIEFNKSVGIRVLRWDPDGVDLELPYADALSAHSGIFHGGVLAALVDTAGAGSVFAGHNFEKGSRLTTISLTVQYLSVGTAPAVVAEARCTRRGRTTHFAEILVRSSGGEPVAQGVAAYNIVGERPGFQESLAKT
jgi:uncharacterized protein (TIGR00369 family)